MFGFNDDFANDTVAQVLQKTDSTIVSVSPGSAVWFKSHGKFYILDVQRIERGMKSLVLRYAHFDYPSKSLSICGETHDKPVCAFNYAKDSPRNTIEGKKLRDCAASHFLSKLMLKSTREDHPSDNDT